MILTSGFKPSIRAKILGENLTVLADIKDLALKIETLEGEKKVKPNGIFLQINPLNKEGDINALSFGNNKGGYDGGGFRGVPSQQRGGGREEYQPRGGYDSSTREGFNNLTRGGYSQPQNE
jgi:hypothetical protein